MPKINLGNLNLSPSELDLVRGIVATKGKNKGCLRASKPKVTRTRVDNPDSLYGYDVVVDDHEGKVAYVWRMVAFYVSPKGQHQCMPVTCDFDLPGSYGPEKRALMVELDRIVDIVANSISKDQWHGVRRWGQVFGIVGTPRYNEEGAVIYR